MLPAPSIRRQFTPSLIDLRCVLKQFLRVTSEIDVRQDGLRLPGDPVVVQAHVNARELLREVCDVVRQAKEVLDVLVLANLAGDFTSVRLKVE